MKSRFVHQVGMASMSDLFFFCMFFFCICLWNQCVLYCCRSQATKVQLLLLSLASPKILHIVLTHTTQWGKRGAKREYVRHGLIMRLWLFRSQTLAFSVSRRKTLRRPSNFVKKSGWIHFVVSTQLRSAYDITRSCSAL